MTGAVDARPIEARIAERYATLSPQERRAADALLDHLDDLALYRAAELADLAGVSKATMSRLFRRLDYDDFTQLREQLRALRSSGVPVTIDGTPSIEQHLEAETEHLHRVLHSAEAAIERAACLLAASASVTVVGLRNSYPVALHLAQQLGQARTGVRVSPSPGQSLSDDVVGLGPQHAAVVVAFRRRPPQLGGLLALLREQGTPVVLLGDPSGRRLAHSRDVWLECGASTQTAFDSYAAAMSVVAAVSARVLDRLGADASARASAIDASYRLVGEIEGG
ncbi:rpiR family transcriptional regulator [Aeromicrobium flavum]|uniref:RpiR family transcriptional regulator n=1 Tax=Aeromicrobium flavum TaxID=416568 RepID=A0A512HVF7_9ACTN|nr:MurR/RpiR family transcriptional regulator [Aeromicrobium flavum]GEO89400.1 rpiR family transcriptional regulator [Aeromicrobium flavum]